MPLVTDVDEEDQAQDHPGISGGSRGLCFLFYSRNRTRLKLVLTGLTSQSRVNEWLSLIDVILKTAISQLFIHDKLLYEVKP